MVTRSRSGTWVVLLATAFMAAGLAYLRDPSWLLSMSTGFGRWGRDPAGIPCRWIAGRASFFVPSDARIIDIPLRTTFERPADVPIIVTIMIDDRPADRLILTDATWRHSVLVMPHPGSRKVRRIDLLPDKVREEGRGVLVGEAAITAKPDR